MFSSISSSRNYQKIIFQIKNAVISGELSIGERLPTELELADEFNVSRSSVREALKALEVLGIVESKKGGGSYIVNNIGQSISDSLSLYFMLRGGTLRDLIDMRASIELGAIQAIIKHGSDEDIESLGVPLKQYLNAATTEERKIYDQNFHALLISLANNPLFDFVLNSLSSVFAKDVSDSHQVVEDLGQLQESLEMHTTIYNAIRDRDFAAASQALYRHFDFTDDDFERQSRYFYFDKTPQ
ncbi:MAG: FadR/GntR family transcriptional regulator [Oscillospiraceae bacterium]